MPGVWHTVAVVIMAIAIVLTVLTGIDYVVEAVKNTRARSAGQ